ncbi:hypothetical protein CXG81DRAFT_21095 [Caulochytrium protostelioides]|uniref:RING-type E3 ubiquitin transferase n=1 Tax=Caulochytrium protostelioides TaxID=1555241 RepID=A0A4P9X1U0_9FUNG|nr:hypothetical protein CAUPRSCDRAFT_10486 [Caulochytrium protostelioides]RKO98728.1 hypothetical protein CXG81DRAFT_21095 [Caulochytrium protostelioides]|eukprot:RKO98728.1 hypothetical protein CXG81DRAFT_21095 [Caulochytrium protostelioides]
MAAASVRLAPRDIAVFPLAGQQELLRAAQKDDELQQHYTDGVLDAYQAIARRPMSLVLRRRLALAASILYYVLSLLSPGRRTPGQEYADLIPTTRGRGTPSRPRLIAATAVGQLLVPYLWRTAHPRGEGARHVAWATRAHAALFLLTGGFVRLSARLAGIRMGLARPRHPGESPRRYELLGALTLIQLLLQVAPTALWGRGQPRRQLAPPVAAPRPIALPAAPEQASASDGAGNPASPSSAAAALPSRPSSPSPQPVPRSVIDCPACLDRKANPAAASCGHVFCWDCVNEWCQARSECPLCRQHINIAHIVPLYQFSL